VGGENEVGVVRGLIRVRDTGEVLDLTSTGLLVETLGVAGLSDLEGHISEDLVKGHTHALVDLASVLTAALVRADERGDGNDTRVGEEGGDLTDTAEVLLTVSGAEAKASVEAEADVVL